LDSFSFHFSVSFRISWRDTPAMFAVTPWPPFSVTTRLDLRGQLNTVYFLVFFGPHRTLTQTTCVRNLDLVSVACFLSFIYWLYIIKRIGDSFGRHLLPPRFFSLRYRSAACWILSISWSPPPFLVLSYTIGCFCASSLVSHLPSLCRASSVSNSGSRLYINIAICSSFNGMKIEIMSDYSNVV